jgi:putative ABC transport system permease protein
MRWRLKLRIMLAALRKNGWRAALAMLCVSLGIGSVMVTLALSTGAERELAAVSDKVGKNIFVVNAGTLQARSGQGWFASTRLVPADIELLAGGSDAVRAVVPVREGSLRVKFNRSNVITTVRGVSEDYVGVRNFMLAAGRMFDGADRASRNRVAVVGPFLAQRLNEGRTLVGETIWVAETPFKVIGQLREKGVSGDGTNEDDQILVPLETAMRRIFRTEYLSSLLVQTYRQQDMDAVQRRARAQLRISHGLDADAKDDFEILSLLKANAVRAMSSQFLQGMSRLFAVITLSIGGAGVFAVTFMNVKDRTSEIGLRMAIGARRRDIAALFMAEACLLSLLGGVLGLVVGTLAVLVLERVTDWTLAIGPVDVLLPFGLSMAMGMLFGVLPAMKASRLKPVEALKAT